MVNYIIVMVNVLRVQYGELIHTHLIQIPVPQQDILVRLMKVILWQKNNLVYKYIVDQWQMVLILRDMVLIVVRLK